MGLRERALQETEKVWPREGQGGGGGHWSPACPVDKHEDASASGFSSIDGSGLSSRRIG